MKLKKIFAAILAFVIVGTLLTACSDSKEESEGTTVTLGVVGSDK